MKLLYVRASDIYNDSRATKEIIALCEKGLHVCVIGWDKHGESKIKCEEVFAEYPVEWFFYESSVKGGLGLKNINDILGWRKFLLHMLVTVKPDVVHLCDLIAGGFVYKYCKKMNVPFIYDMFDHFVDSHDLPCIANYIFECWENNVVNAAHTTIICTEERREQIKKAHPHNVEIIHNSPDVDSYDEYDSITSDYIYCGALSDGRLIKEILELYPLNTHIKMIIAGSGEFSQIAKEQGGKYADFLFLGSIPYAEVLAQEKKAAVISAIYNPALKNHRLCAPNKFYEALALAKPIIVCKNTGIDKVVEKYNIGKVIDYDATQFYSALQFLIDNKELAIEMGKNGRKLYEEKFRWSIMKKRLWDIYENLGGIGDER